MKMIFILSIRMICGRWLIYINYPVFPAVWVKTILAELIALLIWDRYDRVCCYVIYSVGTVPEDDRMENLCKR